MFLSASQSATYQRRRKKHNAAKKVKKTTTAFKPLKVAPTVRREGSDPHAHPSRFMQSPGRVQSCNQAYEGEMAEREAAARAEADRRKSCVAPAYNKGAYQPVWTTEQAKDIGR